MQTYFGGYLKKCPPEASEVYELKYTRGKSLSFDAVKPHQVQALLDAEGKGLYHKITDQPVSWTQAQTRFNKPKPFDCFYVKCKAFVVVWYYKLRQPRLFYKIPIKEFLQAKETCGRKSLTEELAGRIGTQFLCK